MNKRTFAAITSPIGEGGISVIHVSGASSIEIVNKIFRGKGIKDLSRAGDGRLYYGTIEDNGTTIDEAIVSVTRSVETQNLASVQINCHGGILATRRVLDCIKDEGAIEVDWQKLVAQSFENDKIDATQQEALLELIKAKTTLAAKVFLDQYKGALSAAITECGLRTPEDARPGGRISECQKQNNSAIERLLNTADFGIALAHPLKVTIAGSPNAGKSTLTNALLGRERVIVHHEPGTTRDAVTDIVSVDGMPLELTDTAGIRNTNNMIEGLAINETIRRLLATDIAVIVFDNAKPQNEDSLKTIKSLGIPPIPPFSKGGKGGFGVEIIPVVNKIGLPSV
ncbi:MAG: GTP-binding protein, partial [Planctomycetes bacterium]|nr:GTP-binding protein [Planctomycetota bacterium]